MKTNDVRTLTRQCADGLHQFCPGTAATCSCTGCHFGPCSRCGARELFKLFGTLCVECERDRIHAAPPQTTPCDNCGAPKAFRNAKHRRNEYLCLDCHLKSGEIPAVHHSNRELLAACAGADVSDSRHTWAVVRGRKRMCTSCKTVSYGGK